MAVTKLTNKDSDWKKGADGKWTLAGAQGTGSYSANWNGNEGQYYFKDGIMQADTTMDGVYYDKSGLGHALGNQSDAYNQQANEGYQAGLDSYLQYIKDAQAQTQKANELATKQGVDRLESGRQGIYDTARTANTTASTNYETSQSRLPEQLARLGVTGQGTAESSQISANNSYLGNLNEIMNNRNGQLRTLDNAIIDLKNTGDLQSARAYADAAREYANAQLGVADRLYQAGNDQRDFAYRQGRDQVGDQQWQDQFNYGKEQDQLAYQQWLDQFNYNKDRDKVGDKQWQDQFDYTKDRDKVGDKQWQDQFDYTKDRDLVGDSQWDKEHQLDEDKFQWEKDVYSQGSSKSGSGSSGQDKQTSALDSALSNSTNRMVYTGDNNKASAVIVGDKAVAAGEFRSLAEKGLIVPIDNGNGTYTFVWKATQNNKK